MSAPKDVETDNFDELFNAVSSNSIGSLHALILRLKSSSSSSPSPTNSELVYNLLNRAHPGKGLTVLQWAVRVYPKTSFWIIKAILEYGGGTELPTEIKELNSNVTPLWTAVEMKHPIEMIRLLLSFKSDPFFLSNCHPFMEDEKDSLNGNSEGYSLLHLAVKVEADEEIVHELVIVSKGILLNDQGNRLKETPLMLAVKEKNVKMTKLLLKCKGIDLNLKNLFGLTAYELGAKEHSFDVCKAFSDCDLDLPIYYLEIIKRIKVGNHVVWRSAAQYDLRDLNESDDLLPIEGYWEWIDSDWLPCDHGDEKCRLRRRIIITEPFYLKEAIESIAVSPQASLNLLLHGLQQETDPTKKSRVASYFQRLLKWIDERKQMNGTISLLDNLSRSDLMISSGQDALNCSKNAGFGTVPPSNLKSNVDDDTNSESDDSLLYCPVCSHRFSSDRENHLSTCLSHKPGHNLIGSRYSSTDASNVLYGECPICYEDLREREGVVMDCLCRFHRKCIEEWFKRGKRCPFHCE